VEGASLAVLEQVFGATVLLVGAAVCVLLVACALNVALEVGGGGCGKRGGKSPRIPSAVSVLSIIWQGKCSLVNL
jgi:hypothetical protein